MRDVLYLAWRYIAYHRIKTAILVTAIALIVFLPVGLNVLVSQSAAEMTARAENTPLLVGASGSALELVLSSLYFESAPPPAIGYDEVDRIAASGLADPLPLHVRFSARGHPIVGTVLEYFDARGLRVAEGRRFAMIGECVIGAAVAERLGLAPGSSLVSSPGSVFDLGGVYPLKMNVVGVLERSFTADDQAVFVDVKTTWIVEGLGHGHQDLTRADAAADVMARTDTVVTAKGSVRQYNEITAENVESFHFHGDPSGYPVTAIVVMPLDSKSGTILMGRYEGDDLRSQIVKPAAVIDRLLATVFTVQSFVLAAVAMVAAATLATAALVFLLSYRLRRRELQTLVKIGGSRAAVGTLLVAEMVFVIVVSVAVAGGLTAITGRFGSAMIRTMIAS